MKYALITSTTGAQHIGHFPWLSTNLFAHFTHAHMCPHLLQEDEQFKVDSQILSKAITTPHNLRIQSFYLYSKESILPL